MQRGDWRAALAHARADRDVDHGRILAWGYSFGGGHLTAVAARDPDLAAVIVLFPFVSGLRRVLNTPPAVSAWVAPRSVGDWLGRRNTIPATGPEGTRAAMAFAGEQAGFERTIEDGSPWRNEVSPGVFLTVGLHRPVIRAASIRCPLWVGIGDRDITVDNGAAARLAARAPQGEAHHNPMDHFDPFTLEGVERVAADQLEFLRRVARPHASAGA
jgi:dienelactone hydrolase